MRIGISSWSCPWAIGVAGYPTPPQPLGALGLVALAQELGVAVLQIADNLPLHTLPVAQLDALAQAARQAGVALEVGTRGLNPDNLRTYLAIARRLGAGLVRTLPHDGADRPDAVEAARRLNSVQGDFAAAGVILAIENHDLYPSAWLRALVQGADSPWVGVCLDAVNNLGLGESFREVLGTLGAQTVNFHCKDYAIARKPTMLGFDVVGAPAGEGMLDLHLARRTLRGDISWIIESWLPWQGSIEDTVVLERQWLRRGVENLRRFASEG